MHQAQNEPWGAGIMNTRRFATVTLCRSVVLAGCVAAWPVAIGLAGGDSGSTAALLAADASVSVADAKPADAAPVAAADDRAVSDAKPSDAPLVAATDDSTTSNAAPAEAPQALAASDATVTVAAVAPIVIETVSSIAADTTTASEQPAASGQPEAAIVTASLNASEMLPSEPAPAQDAAASPRDRSPVSTVRSVEVLDECSVVEACLDRYLWAVYLRTPKEDSIRQSERRAVTVKRKHRTVTVMRTFTRLVDEDFAWKDPKAADRAGMPMMDYVIGGMDRSFKLKLFHTLLAAEAAGLSPGITSAFRDDYRQSIATGLKAATGRSYHGGSTRGGYGHGVAADIVSVKGGTRAQRWVSTEQFWKWIDSHGKEFGIARPYLGRDPPHVGPIDGQEYASKRGGDTRHAAAHVSARKRLAMRGDHGVAKRTGSVRASKASTMRSARNTPSRLHG